MAAAESVPAPMASVAPQRAGDQDGKPYGAADLLQGLLEPGGRTGALGGDAMHSGVAERR